MLPANSKRRRFAFSRGTCAKRHQNRSRRLGLEALETRQMLSATPVQLVSHAGEFSGAGESYLKGQQQQISADGRYVAFVSNASDLVSGYSFTPGLYNVYRYDRLTDHVDLVSVNVAGTGSGNEDSGLPAISADGSVVAFVSVASDLSPLDSNGSQQDVFARNFTTNTTSLVSENFAGTGSGNGTSYGPVISADGRIVAFDSDAGNLHSLDTNGTVRDVFARDLATGTTTLVSINAVGTGSGNQRSGSHFDVFGGGGFGPPNPTIGDTIVRPAISADGNVVAFQSSANNLSASGELFDPFRGMYVRNLDTTTTTLIAAAHGFGEAVISANGNVVAYERGGTQAEIEAYNLATGDRTQVTSGANGPSIRLALSADGGVITYQSLATNLQNPQTAVPDTNGTWDVFVHNNLIGNRLVSVNSAGTASGNNASGFPMISADGTVVAFDSIASDLDPLDTNGNINDVFVRNLAVGNTRLVSTNLSGSGSGNHDSYDAVISANGKYVAFTSEADNLVSGDANAFKDTFLVTIGPHSVIRVDESGDLVLSDNAFGGKADNLRISYDSGAETVIIEDLNGDPIVSTVGSSNGTSLVQVHVGDFAGGVVVNGGAGNDRLTLDSSIFESGKHVQFDGGTGSNLVTVSLPVNPTTISNDLQDVVSLVRGSTISTINAPRPQVTMVVDSSNLAAVASAVQSLAPNTSEAVVEVVMELSGNDYSGQALSVPDGVQLIVEGNATFAVGSAPGLTIESGDVHLIGLSASSTVDASTILVTGGSLVVHNSTIRETSGGNRAAFEIFSGNVDLGTSGSPGGNTFDASGPGQLVRNLSSQSILGLGNTFKVDGTPLPDGFAIEGRVYHGLDQAGIGIVYWVDRNLYATISSGSIQSVIDAAAANDVVNVQSGLSQDYNVGDKLLTVAFQSGGAVSQQLDELNPSQRKLTVNGTAGNDNISFKEMGDVVDLVIAGYPTGTFKPTSRLEVLGLGGDDVIDATHVAKVAAWLEGGNGNDILKGGNGNDVIQGGADNDQLVSGGGKDLLIGGGGSDQVGGGGGEDILISGTTSFDTNNAALLAILTEWNSTRSYAERVANILGTGTGASFAARLNANYFLNVDTARGTVTVLDDDAQDTLNGGAGVDLYFANLVLDANDQATHTDVITSLKNGEQAVDTDLQLPPPPDP